MYLSKKRQRDNEILGHKEEEKVGRQFMFLLRDEPLHRFRQLRAGKRGPIRFFASCFMGDAGNDACHYVVSAT